MTVEQYLHKNWGKGDRGRFILSTSTAEYELTKRGNNILIERGIVTTRKEWQYIFDGYIDTVEELELIFKLCRINEN